MEACPKVAPALRSLQTKGACPEEVCGFRKRAQFSCTCCRSLRKRRSGAACQPCPRPRPHTYDHVCGGVRLLLRILHYLTGLCACLLSCCCCHVLGGRPCSAPQQQAGASLLAPAVRRGAGDGAARVCGWGVCRAVANRGLFGGLHAPRGAGKAPLSPCTHHLK